MYVIFIVPLSSLCLFVRYSSQVKERVSAQPHSRAGGVVADVITSVIPEEQWFLAPKQSLPPTSSDHPTVAIKGCIFHWTQAVWRHVQSLGLARAYKEQQEVHNYIR